MYAHRAPLVTPARAPIAQLLHDLRAVGDLRRHAATVDARLDGFTPRIDELVRHVSWPRRGYARTLIHRDDAFELLVLSWAPGSRAPLHDHAGQDCWLVPLAGAFDLDDYAIVAASASASSIAATSTRRFMR
jgi:cysteine dioxygenase